MVNIKKRENVRDVRDEKRKKIPLGLVRDLHPLDNTHASQTKNPEQQKSCPGAYKHI